MSDSKLQSFCNLFQTKFFYLIVFLKTLCHQYVVAFFPSRKRFGTGRMNWRTFETKKQRNSVHAQAKVAHRGIYRSCGIFWKNKTNKGKGGYVWNDAKWHAFGCYPYGSFQLNIWWFVVWVASFFSDAEKDEEITRKS